MRFLCARRPRFFKGSPLLEAAADEVLSGADVSAIGRGGRRVALGSSVHGAPGSARGGRDVQKWPPRAGAGPTGARGLPASCSAPPSPTLASCPALTSALQAGAGSGGAGVALGLGGGPPPCPPGTRPGLLLPHWTRCLREAWHSVSGGQFATSQRHGGPLVRRG